MLAAEYPLHVNTANPPEKKDKEITKEHIDVGQPEFVPNYTVDQEVGSGDKAEENMGDIAKEMVPSREAFAHHTFSYACSRKIRDEKRKQDCSKYLRVSTMIISSIMMIILGTLLTMKMTAIMIRTIESRCSLLLHKDPIYVLLVNESLNCCLYFKISCKKI